MPDLRDIGQRAYIAIVAQKLAAPAQAIFGYQELITEEVREHGPHEALSDLQKVLQAARMLNALIEHLTGSVGADLESMPSVDANVRHDLRTPVNAIIGYSEMVLEDFGDKLGQRLLDDISRIIAESRLLLEQVDAMLERPAHFSDISAEGTTDVTIAADLARTMTAGASSIAVEAGHILVVDDTESNRDLLARRLERDGHAVEAAASGREALEKLGQGDFDLVLADVLMPDMNGIELLARLKSDEEWREIPVVMVSGLKDEDAVIRCIEAGAEDYLQKPVDPILLKARIRACLERSRWRGREKRYLAEIEYEKERADALLHAILPGQVVKRLANGEAVIADRIDMASILFADIVNFTELSARTPAVDLVHRLGTLFSRFDDLADQHGIEKIKTIGDAYMAAAGLPDPRSDHAKVAVSFAKDILAETEKTIDPASPLRLRIGIHSGPLIAGLIGRKRFVYDVWGHTVNLASRMESYGKAGRIQISQCTFDELDGDCETAIKEVLDIRGIGPCTTYVLA
ncbi:response regulator [Stappia sp. GBMRC 2046]|uniref:histidine kinase n=1 Tax=Stappia sediminis TaxID=2692190 RepID=A0A7X3S7V9_9HYPH|nr:adenylate/guanylate cyclase domain-containing protein [Stappia sediminis]MXN65203.1 response regulator [Stappia sediminis]